MLLYLILAALVLSSAAVLFCVYLSDARASARLPVLPDAENEPEDAGIAEAKRRMGPVGLCPKCQKRVNPMEKTCPHCGEPLAMRGMKSFGGRSLSGEDALIDEVNRWLFVNRSAIRVRADFSTAVRSGFPAGREVLSRVMLTYDIAGVKRREDYALVAPRRRFPFRARSGAELLSLLLRRYPDARVVSATDVRAASEEDDALAILRAQRVYALLMLPNAKWERRRGDAWRAVLWVLIALLVIALFAGLYFRLIAS
ncbi:MAG: zinc ribbon domain-containing protein [Clostridia bacterium]|nr:zinc ribbon domain-containing protein [Clostridia bacterium]